MLVIGTCRAADTSAAIQNTQTAPATAWKRFKTSPVTLCLSICTAILQLCKGELAAGQQRLILADLDLFDSHRPLQQNKLLIDHVRPLWLLHLNPIETAF